MFSLQGKVALVTGASKGIGEAMAYTFGKAGAQVVVSSRKQEAVEAVARKFKSVGLKQTIGIACNVGKAAEIEALVSKTIEHFGRIDIIVNNAGTNPVYSPMMEMEESAYDKIMDVNLKGAWLLTKAAHPHLKASGQGCVINIASIEGLSPSPNLGAYSISKAGMVMLTKVLARELGEDHIRVNAICPGYIRTKLSEMVWQDKALLREVMHKQCMNYEANPEDLSGLALMLAAGTGKFLTGAIITADGGYTV
jgi:NAD(P)-dependent dehydrogenase (short-subunit alcohol dehydrogenase family)